MREVMLCSNFLHSPVSILSCSRLGVSVCCSLMDDTRRSKFMEFPFVSGGQKNLMVDLVSTLENRLESQLLPSTLPPDVRHYQNPTATAQASLHIRAAHTHSPVIYFPSPLFSLFHYKFFNFSFFPFHFPNY